MNSVDAQKEAKKAAQNKEKMRQQMIAELEQYEA